MCLCEHFCHAVLHFKLLVGLLDTDFRHCLARLLQSRRVAACPFLRLEEGRLPALRKALLEHAPLSWKLGSSDFDDVQRRPETDPSQEQAVVLLVTECVGEHEPGPELEVLLLPHLAGHLFPLRLRLLQTPQPFLEGVLEGLFRQPPCTDVQNVMVCLVQLFERRVVALGAVWVVDHGKFVVLLLDGINLSPRINAKDLEGVP
mmetsp:Transcript_52633/g.93934  ORF Transcript_52633/g.93934 Transcript_52633/m.93934 type:complete len:203 (+) Transcript_52633:277-885(+)